MAKIAETTLPSTWKWIEVQDVYDVLGGGTPSTKIEEYWTGDVPWITSADIHGWKDIRPRKKITKEAIEDSATSLVPENTIIVVTRVSLGKVAITEYPLCFSQDSQALVPKTQIVDQKFALYYLTQATKEFLHTGRGTTISGVTKKQLKTLPMPLAPLEEQHRIVAKIEELLSQLDAGVEALEKAQAKLKRYKASVLKAACEGRLVPTEAELARKEGREFEAANVLLKRMSHYDSVGAPYKLPEGWEWTTVGSLSELIQYGSSEKASKDQTGIPILRMGNIQEGVLVFKDLKYLPHKGSDVNKYLLKPNDLVFNRTNSAELVGKTAVYYSEHPTAAFASYLIRVRPNKYCVARFLAFVINSHFGRSYIKSVVSQQVGQANVNGTKLAAMPIPLPPFAEQLRIVEEVEKNMTMVNELQETIETNLHRSLQMKQSILRIAFEGALVEN